MTIVNTTFFQSYRIMDIIDDQSREYQMVRMAIDRMVRDISCSYVPSNEFGLTDEEISLYRFTGKDEMNNDRDIDSIYFTTTSEIGMSDLSIGIGEVGYFLKETEDDPDVFYLIRREDKTPHYGISEKGSQIELAEDIIGMNIVYIYDGSQEAEKWDLAERLRLPDQVRITLTMQKDEEELSFEGVAFLPMSEIEIKLSEEER